jgi:hypothetical protein
VLSDKKSGGEDGGEEKWMVEVIGERWVEIGGNVRVLERQGGEDGQWRYASSLQMDEEPTSEKLKILEGQGRLRVYKLLGRFPASGT